MSWCERSVTRATILACALATLGACAQDPSAGSAQGTTGSTPPPLDRGMCATQKFATWAEVEELATDDRYSASDVALVRALVALSKASASPLTRAELTQEPGMRAKYTPVLTAWICESADGKTMRIQSSDTERPARGRVNLYFGTSTTPRTCVWIPNGEAGAPTTEAQWQAAFGPTCTEAPR